MNINATMIGQTIAFLLFVWFTKAYVWSFLMAAMEERKQKIADGLAAAERGKHEQELAEKRAAEVIAEAKAQGQEIISKAEKRASEIVEEAKDNARTEGDRLLTAANAEIEQEVNRAKEGLRSQVVSLAVAGAGRVLNKELDSKAHDDMLKDLVSQI